MSVHPHDCDCIRCENARDEGLPTDGSCHECLAPHDTPHRDGCGGQFHEDRVGEGRPRTSLKPGGAS